VTIDIEAASARYDAILADLVQRHGSLSPGQRAVAEMVARMLARPHDDPDVVTAALKLEALLPPRPEAKAGDDGIDWDRLNDDEHHLLDCLVAKARGITVEALDLEAVERVRALDERAAGGFHYVGRLGCSCGVCSPAELGQQLVDLRCENATLRERLRCIEEASIAGPKSHQGGDKAEKPAETPSTNIVQMQPRVYISPNASVHP
jgi:hypothetical protein